LGFIASNEPLIENTNSDFKPTSVGFLLSEI
jgi:hypothetical protein